MNNVSVALMTAFIGLMSTIVSGIALPDPTADMGGLVSLQFESTALGDHEFALRGPDARHQLAVTGIYSTGQLRDVTREVNFEVSPDGVLSVDQTGLATPIRDGQVTITAAAAGDLQTTTIVTVQHIADPPRVNFPNQVVPIFTKLTCNSGGCHGKSAGQNGFALSLLGFEPQEDYEHLVKEGRGRRLFPAAADNSLLLLKATNTVPHGGGMRMKPDSHDYRVLWRWIEQGMPYGHSDDPTLDRIEVYPPHRIMLKNTEQQLSVFAHFSDGSISDITHMAHYDSNEKELAEISESGLMNVSAQSGDASIMVRYQERASVFRATIPLGAPMTNVIEPANFIDEHVIRKLHILGLPPSPLCDDATFVRRTTLDIAGRLPTPQETTRLLESTDPNRRNDWIDYLLASGDYADFFANKWGAILRNRSGRAPSANFRRRTFAFHDWIRQCFYENVPYDRFVRGIVAASGDMDQNPPVVWYVQVDGAKKQMEDVAQLFLGVRMQCAQCHHHPFEKWSQNDYYGFTAFFSQVKSKPWPNEFEPRVFHERGEAKWTNPKTEQDLRPTALGAETLALAAENDPRHSLVDWMAQKDNPFFAQCLVNRYWKHFFNRGLVDPEDDMRVTNPASNPELLDALANEFRESRFDLKALVRVICQSNTYQLSSIPNEHNADDKQNFSRYYPRRLHAEVLLDAIDTFTDSHTEFNEMPSDTRAVQIPDAIMGTYFLTLFGRPQGASASESERTADANLAQSLHMLNSEEIQNKLASGRAEMLLEDIERNEEQKIRELYLLAYSRPVNVDEVAIALNHIEAADPAQRRQAYEDIIWAMINTKEFIFNH